MSELVKRSRLRHFLKTDNGIALIGDGVTELSVSMNPETESEQYIHQDSATTFLKNYAIAMDTTQTAKKGDDVYDYVDMLGWKQAVGADAETEVYEVRIYMSDDETGPFQAKKWNCNIAVNDYGGAGTDPLGITYTINIEGDPVFGTFDLDALKFTQGAAPAGFSPSMVAAKTLTQAKQEESADIAPTSSKSTRS